MAFRVLNDEQVQSFLDNGYLVVKGCVDLDIAQSWIDHAYERLGYTPGDPTTWQKDIVWLDHAHQLPIPEVAPRAWDALLDVIGGEERLEKRVMYIESAHFSSIDSFLWSDAFVANFRFGADRTWEPPSPDIRGWHKDGSYFRHFLDSREQALLPVVCWSDMRHQGGATFIAPDSVRVIAQYLAERPEGVVPSDFDFKNLIRQCERFEELTGEAGDFIIMHPFMLHASSQNVLGVPRFMTNPPVVLKEPMNFNRDSPDEFSLLERATLHYLGKERLDFRPAHIRESYWM